MRKLAAPLIFLWRVWFYVAVFLAIVLLLPFIFIHSLNEGRYRSFFRYARLWAKLVLLLSGFSVKLLREEQLDPDQAYIIIANHTSMLDIMLCLSVVPVPFVFIGKAELAKLPLFGYFYKRTNLLVDRSSLRSRRDVFDRAALKLKDGIGLCIFPEGGVPKDETIVLDHFKPGAFRLAKEGGFPIVPMSLLDCKRRFPFSWSRGLPGSLRVVMHPIIDEQQIAALSEVELTAQARKTIFDPLNQEDTQQAWAQT